MLTHIFYILAFSILICKAAAGDDHPCKQFMEDIKSRVVEMKENGNLPPCFDEYFEKFQNGERPKMDKEQWGEFKACWTEVKEEIKKQGNEPEKSPECEEAMKKHHKKE